ncbi:hypothetical protein FB565_007328 [Actinoplanes lutulentus]|uniref:Uncharacterized protein n=1 Tax=Actinoplanes lutulentus TaxID=1287878 RepID=A0A327YXG6_9ACTN|nr:hypothetical protein [Actinoplanes lutulentus]MBB2947557.1 hypothetical protein [Actinoplanes lutulentus]RAK25713.1 hypothetical protein B0I29_13164 [Actinoplanes lutulentus]
MPDVPGEKRTPDGHPAIWDEGTDAFAGRSGIARDGKDGKGWVFYGADVLLPGGNGVAGELAG